MANLIDGCDQIIIVDLPPWVAGEQVANCHKSDIEGGSEIGSAVVGVRVIDVVLICIGLMSSSTLSALMTQEIDPTMKIWPGRGRDEEPAKRTILFNMEQHAHPYLARQLSIEYHWQSSEGYAMMVD